jgi:hypothetical protein
MFGQRSKGFRGLFDGCLFVVRCAAVSVEVFLHKRFGSRYCRLQAAMVLPLGFCNALVWDWAGYDVDMLLKFLAAYAFTLVMSFVGVVQRLRRGDQEHSLYSGWPLLLSADRPDKEVRAKQWVEPALVLVVGVVINKVNHPLGAWLIFAAASLFVKNAVANWWQRTQIIDMQDAVFEQYATAGGFRALHGR